MRDAASPHDSFEPIVLKKSKIAESYIFAIGAKY